MVPFHAVQKSPEASLCYQEDLLKPQAYPAASYRLVSNGPGRSNSSVRFNQALCLFTFIDLVIELWLDSDALGFITMSYFF